MALLFAPIRRCAFIKKRQITTRIRKDIATDNILLLFYDYEILFLFLLYFKQA